MDLVHYSNFCLASPANLIYGRGEAKLLSQVTFMPALFGPANSFHRKCGEIQYCKQHYIRGSDLSKMSEFGD